MWLADSVKTMKPIGRGPQLVSLPQARGTHLCVGHWCPGESQQPVFTRWDFPLGLAPPPGVDGPQT